MNEKRFLITGDTVGYTELPRNRESVPVENEQVLFDGRAKDMVDAVRQCRKMWEDYDLDDVLLSSKKCHLWSRKVSTPKLQLSIPYFSVFYLSS